MNKATHSYLALETGECGFKNQFKKPALNEAIVQCRFFFCLINGYQRFIRINMDQVYKRL